MSQFRQPYPFLPRITHPLLLAYSMPPQDPSQEPYYQPPQYTPPPVQPPPKKRSRGKFFAIGYGGLIALIVLIAIIIAGASAGNSSTSTNTADTGATQAAQDTPTQPLDTPTAVPTQAPTTSPAQSEQTYKAGATTTTVANLDKDGNNDSGENVHFTATILNFVKDDTGTTAGANVDDPNAAGSVIQVGFPADIDLSRLNTGDSIEVWGQDTGTASGTNAFGATIQEVVVSALFMTDQTTSYVD